MNCSILTSNRKGPETMSNAKLKLFGSPPARVTRPMWVMAELGLAYDQVPVMPGPPSAPKSPELLAVNPMGQTPVLVDGELAISESLAINLYLAQVYGQGTLWPDTMASVGKAYQWTLFGAFNLERPVLPLMIHRLALPPEHRREDQVERAMTHLARPLAAMNAALHGHDWLAGDRFTVADLNVASILNAAISADIWFDDHPAVSDWLRRCYARPSAKDQRVTMRVPPEMAADVAAREMPL
jgi:glutathione S-transferase